jgi:Ca2+-binding RTX toxin-like protein
VIDNADNSVLASAPLNATTSIVLFGTSENDNIVVNLSDSRLRVSIEVHGGGGDADTLAVVGSTRADLISVDPYRVNVNGVDVFYGNVETIEVNAGRGNDIAQVRGPVAPTVVINGEQGNDVLAGNGVYTGRGSTATNPGTIILSGGDNNDLITGSDRADILLGGTGSDILLGLSGRDLIIAGRGADLVTAGPGEDIVIGNSTAHDNDVATLLSILAVWNTTTPQSARIALLTPLLNSSTVFNDFSIDLLFGGLGEDWFAVPFAGDVRI